MEKLVLEIVARRNTWSNQRRKRRQEKLQSQQNVKKRAAEDPADGNGDETPAHKRQKTDFKDGSDDQQPCERNGDQASVTEASQQPAASAAGEERRKSCDQATEGKQDHDDLDMTLSIEDVTEFVVRSRLTLVKDADDILLQLLWLEGCKESLYQILQFFKNRLR